MLQYIKAVNWFFCRDLTAQSSMLLKIKKKRSYENPKHNFCVYTDNYYNLYDSEFIKIF